MSTLDLLTADLDWREAELGSLKLLLARDSTTSHQRTVLLRACWALLYAHYEGFAKFSLTVFFDRARLQVLNCGLLPNPTKSFALESALKKMRSLPSADFLAEIDSFGVTHYALKPSFGEVDTKSNLWPNVLEELLSLADLPLPYLAIHSAKLKTLVNRRNAIAHGKREFIEEVGYYRTFESAVYDLMYELAFEIDSRLNRPPYI